MKYIIQFQSCAQLIIYHTVQFNTAYPHKNNLCCGGISVWVEGITSLVLYILCAIDLIHPYNMTIVAVKLLSILMNLGKTVLQVGCFDKIIQPISNIQYIYSSFLH